MNIDNVILAAEHLTGFVIVMLALSALWGLTGLVGRYFARAAERAPRPAPPVPSAPVADAAVEDDIVVIAAATQAMLESSHRVIAVRPVPSSWGQQGRRDIHASHRIR